eukprot:2790127-Rhodomonas_salina.1
MVLDGCSFLATAAVCTEAFERAQYGAASVSGLTVAPTWWGPKRGSISRARNHEGGEEIEVLGQGHGNSPLLIEIFAHRERLQRHAIEVLCVEAVHLSVTKRRKRSQQMTAWAALIVLSSTAQIYPSLIRL